MIDLFKRKRIAELERELDESRRDKENNSFLARENELIQRYAKRLTEAYGEISRLQKLESAADREAIAKIFISKLIGPVHEHHIEDAYRLADKWIAVRGADGIHKTHGEPLICLFCQECSEKPRNDSREVCRRCAWCRACVHNGNCELQKWRESK